MQLVRKDIYWPTDSIPVALYLFDILIMQSRIRERYRCVFIAYFTATVITIVIVADKPRSKPRRWVFLVAFILLVIAQLAIAITRIRWPRFKEPQEEVQVS